MASPSQEAEKTVSRFESPASELTLRSLLGQSKTVLWAGSLLALALHASLSSLVRTQTTREVSKPLTTRFVKRQPRLSKPLELRKQPRPRQRALRRKVVSVQAKADRDAAASPVQLSGVVRSLARPRAHLGRSAVWVGEVAEPLTVAEAIAGSKEHQDKVDMSLEMVDVDALDTGQYRAMVIVDPDDKRSVTGFLHLGVVYVESMFAHSPEAAALDILDYIRNVVYAMNRYTAINTDLRGYYTFDSREMLSIPWVFVNTHGVRFTLTGSEAANLGAYFTRGGFLFMEGTQPHAWERFSGNIACRQELISGQNMLKDGLAAAGHRHGRDWTFEKVLAEHPLYHCYFDFDGPLPSYRPHLVLKDEFMYGVTISERLVAIFETGDYERFINNGKGDSRPIEGSRYRQFLVNVVVYALTQEGSVTRRLMDTVNY